jgi:signal peptidase II
MTPAPAGCAEPRAAKAASRGRWWLLMGVAALLIALDQGVKWTVATNLPLGEGITVTAWFNLVHVLNPGASFSFLADAGGWQRHALTAIGLAVSIVLAVLLRRGVRSRFETAAYVGLIGGALGNVGSAALLVLASFVPGAAGREAAQGDAT